MQLLLQAHTAYLGGTKPSRGRSERPCPPEGVLKSSPFESRTSTHLLLYKGSDQCCSNIIQVRYTQRNPTVRQNVKKDEPEQT